jgi:hypothetical protein
MLKFGEANPLTIFGLRRVDHCPPHFTRFLFDLRGSEKVLTDWIWENLSGRFYFGDEYVAVDKEKLDPPTMQIYKLAAFEIPGEASYFSLVIDTIDKTDW